MKRKIKKKLIFVNSILIGGLFFYVLSLSSVQAATFEFVPSSATFTSCQNTIDIYIDATGEDANAADIEVFFDESKIQITDSSGSIPGTQIIEGVAFEEYMGNYVFNSTGSFFLTGGSYPTTTNTLTDSKLFASITFDYSGLGAGETVNFEFRFENLGNTFDTNIADAVSGDDILTSVVNGSFTFLPDCSESGSSGGGGTTGGGTSGGSSFVSQPIPSDINNTICTDDVKQLTEEGVVRGYSDGLFKPELPVTRGQMATFIVKGFNITTSPAPETDLRVRTNEELALYINPDLFADSLVSVPAGEVFIVGDSSVPGWYQIVYNGETGWILESFVVPYSQVPFLTQGQVIGTPNEFLRIRTEPNIYADVVARVSEGEKVVIYEKNDMNWYRVGYGDIEGWASSYFIETTNGYVSYEDDIGIVHRDDIIRLTKLGLVWGYSDGTYRYDDSLRRGEAAKFVYSGLKESGHSVDFIDTHFADIPLDSKYRGYIGYLEEYDVINGFSDGSYRQEQFITRCEMARIVNGARKL